RRWYGASLLIVSFILSFAILSVLVVWRAPRMVQSELLAPAGFTLAFTLFWVPLRLYFTSHVRTATRDPLTAAPHDVGGLYLSEVLFLALWIFHFAIYVLMLS